MPSPSLSPPQDAYTARTAAIRRRLDRAYVVVLPPDELDTKTADDFRARLLAIETNTDVVVDLRRLVFCGSAGIQALLEARRDLEGRDCTLSLSCPSPIFERLLAICGLDGEFAIRRPTSRRARAAGGADPSRR